MTADVAVVGCGPTGCAAALFPARYGLETVVFDRGRSSLARCGHLENYPGFPGGIDVETFAELLVEHVAAAGCTVERDLVERVERAGDSEGFVVEPQSGDPVAADRVIAATRYGGEYLRPLSGEAMFETVEVHGEPTERFDRSYPDDDGRTPVEGLSVAAPSTAADGQAILAAGRGARVGVAVVEAVRRERGYPDPVAEYRDWVRRAAELDERWDDREEWREWFDDRRPDDELADDRWRELREREIDRRQASYLSDDEIAAAAERGQRRLLEHLDDALVLERAREIAPEGENPTVSD